MAESDVILATKKRMRQEGVEEAWVVQRDAMIEEEPDHGKAAAAAEDVLADWEFREVRSEEEIRCICENLDTPHLDKRQTASAFAFSILVACQKDPKLKGEVLKKILEIKIKKIEKVNPYARMQDNGQTIIELCDAVKQGPEEVAA